MLATVVLAAASFFVASPYDIDPSLSSAATSGAASVVVQAARAMASSTGLLLSYDGIELAWDAGTKQFALRLGGTAVGDLVTSTDSRGWPSFEGLWSGTVPGVFGSVDTPDSKVWTVEITRPSHKPMLFFVIADGADAVVKTAQICDCADGIGLTCTTSQCRDGGSCSAGTSTCKFKDP